MAKWCSKEFWDQMPQKDKKSLDFAVVSEVIYYLKDDRQAIFLCTPKFNGSIWSNSPLFSKLDELITTSVNEGKGLQIIPADKAPFFRVRQDQIETIWGKTDKGFKVGADDVMSEDDFFS